MFWCCMTCQFDDLIQLKSEACSNHIPPHAPYNVQAVIHASQCVCHSKNIRVVFFFNDGNPRKNRVWSQTKSFFEVLSLALGSW